MPSTRSRAATKCISEVPGLAKQTSTPPATRVRTRLSAPFIVRSRPRGFFGFAEDQSFLAHFVKGFPGHCSYRRDGMAFLTAALENWALTGSLLAQSRQLWPVLRPNRFYEGNDDPGFCFV